MIGWRLVGLAAVLGGCPPDNPPDDPVFDPSGESDPGHSTAESDALPGDDSDALVESDGEPAVPVDTPSRPLDSRPDTDPQVDTTRTPRESLSSPVDETDSDTVNQPDSSAGPADSDTPADTDEASAPGPATRPAETATEPRDTSAATPGESDGDPPPDVHTDSHRSADTTGPGTSGGDSSHDSDGPPESGGHSDVETSRPDTSNHHHTGPDTVEVTESPPTPIDTQDTDPTDTPDPWPVPPRCTFRSEGVHVIQTGYRSIDFDQAAGAGLAVTGNHLPVNGGDQVHELGVHIGPSSVTGEVVFLRAPPEGNTFYTDLIEGAVRRDRIRTNEFVKRHGAVDLDADGNADYLTRAHTVTTTDCLAFQADPVEKTLSMYDWRFFDSSASGPPILCDAVDVDGDAFVDLNIIYEQADHSGLSRWYPGPFARGEVDLAGRANIEAQTEGPTDLSFDAYGDFNADGLQDMAIAWYGADRSGGELLLWFGPIAGTLDLEAPDLRIEGTTDYGIFVLYQPENLGDIDGDGVDDLGVTSTGYNFDGILESGAVFIFKGPLHPGPPLHDLDADTIITWPTALARTGHTLVPLGDVDGDERADFSVGVWGDSARMPDGFDHHVVWPPGPPTVRTVAGPVDTSIDTWDSADSANLDSGWAWPYPYPAPPPGFPYSSAEGAIMVFGDVPPGVVGPAQAKFTLMGAENDFIGRVGVIGPGDLNGDGLADLAFSGDPYGTGVHVFVVYPCADFGTSVTP
jgi:hypothetical protein